MRGGAQRYAQRCTEVRVGSQRCTEGCADGCAEVRRGAQRCV